jgi:hypothetical protein
MCSGSIELVDFMNWFAPGSLPGSFKLKGSAHVMEERLAHSQ